MIDIQKMDSGLYVKIVYVIIVRTVTSMFIQKPNGCHNIAQEEIWSSK